MRTTTRFVLGLSTAGVVAAGGSAMTAGNTGVVQHYAGYQKATVEGVDVSNIEYRRAAGDSETLTHIVFSVLDEVPDTQYSQVLTVWTLNGSNQRVRNTSYDDLPCDYAAGPPRTLTCAVPGLAVAAVDAIDLSVTPVSVPTPAASPVT